MVALKFGVRLRGTMNYDCLVTHLKASAGKPGARYTITVEAENPSDAARAAAEKIAKKHYTGGEPSFVTEFAGTFLAFVGRQERAADGIVTVGFTIKINVAPSYADKACDERRCDHCQALYRGPAVYCSLECALADA